MPRFHIDKQQQYTRAFGEFRSQVNALGKKLWKPEFTYTFALNYKLGGGARAQVQARVFAKVYLHCRGTRP